MAKLEERDGVLYCIENDGYEWVYTQPVSVEVDAGPSELDIIGEQIVEKDLQILSLQEENRMLGEQIVALDLRLLALEGGTTV